MTPITGRPHRLADKPPTLELDDVTVELTGALGSGRALSEVSLEVWPGEIVGLIGESGSGKTMAALSILGLAPSAARLTAGEIRLSGSPLTGLSAAELRAIRGNRLAMIPQDAMTAMNPVLRVNTQVGEPYVLHRKFPWRAAKERAVSLLKTVHMPSAEQRARDYPHQLSGGMLQRAMIAMGLALEPELLNSYI